MKAVIQRVSEAQVRVEGSILGHIEQGYLILFGVAAGDTEALAEKMALKIVNLRLFADAEGKMNLDIKAANGAILVISQFTLLADTQKGNRPSFLAAEKPERAKALYLHFCNFLVGLGVPIAQGQFGADMKVSLINDGPVTIILENEND
jgi:D-tyrosyl-tRNA(Tyr) deacylase